VVAVDPDQLLGLSFLKGFDIFVRVELLRAVLRYQTTRVSFGTAVAAVVSGLALTAAMPKLSRKLHTFAAQQRELWPGVGFDTGSSVQHRLRGKKQRGG